MGSRAKGHTGRGWGRTVIMREKIERDALNLDAFEKCKSWPIYSRLIFII